jgi:Bardet-Biedl syndrome 1 protein
MRFGKIGREEGCLFLLYKNKGIDIKVLNRKMVSSTDAVKETVVAKVNKEKPELKPPARSRIFGEQLEVDKTKSTATYNGYQKDNLKLKNLVDEQYLKLMARGLLSENKKVKIHADIEGLGPVFKIHLDLTNQGQKPLTDLVLLLQFSNQNYKLLDSLPEVKFLLPNILLPIVFRLQNISELGTNEDIKVFIAQKAEFKPLAGAVINMPVCDPMIGR